MSLLSKYLDDFLARHSTKSAPRSAHAQGSPSKAPEECASGPERAQCGPDRGSGEEYTSGPEHAQSGRGEECVSGPERAQCGPDSSPGEEYASGPEHAQSGPGADRKCEQCGSTTAIVYLVMTGGWMLCSRCYSE